VSLRGLIEFRVWLDLLQSFPRLAIALNSPNTSTPSFIPSPDVIANSLPVFSARRLSKFAAMSPVTAPMRAPNNSVLFLFIVIPLYHVPVAVLGGVPAAESNEEYLSPSKECLDACTKPVQKEYRFDNCVRTAFDVSRGLMDVILRKAGIGRHDVKQFRHQIDKTAQ
jgi:hypothetical protein